MKRIAVVVAVSLVSSFLAGAVQALPISTASVGNGKGCSDQACTDQTLMWSSNSGGGTGTLSIVGTNLTFSITLASTTFVPVPSLGGSDNGVTQLVFSSTTYAGSATLLSLGSGFYSILSGSASISGTQTPSGAGSAGPFSASNALLGGSCNDSGSSITCGIVFGPSTDFNFALNGQTRHFTHTVNVTAPEPAAVVLLGVGLAVAWSLRQRTRRG